MLQSIQERVQALLHSANPLSEDEVQSLIEQEPELAKLLILEQSRRLRELDAASAPSPSTPSGMVPAYQKPAVKKRKKKPGRPEGHKGVRRAAPPQIDREVEHRLDRCPECASPLRPCTSPHSTRTRIIEDIPEAIHPVVTKHLLHRDYCPSCKKLVEPKIPDALPNAAIGNRLVALSAHWHYGLGMPISQIVELLNTHLHFPLSEGGLVQMWQRLAQVLEPWYEQLTDRVQTAAVLHADETGWRVNGKTHWLWCFTTQDATVYMIHPSRGSPALLAFFKEAFEGALITDFWAAYDAIANGKRQFCLAHLLRELEKVDQTNSSSDWCAFSKKARRLFRDALRLRAREGYAPDAYASRIQRLYGRLVDLMLIESADADVRRLAKRLQKYWEELLTFLEDPTVPATNNHAEREIRPAVIMRKVMQGNRSDKGAQTQSVLMSLLRTLKRRDLPVVDTVVDALQSIASGHALPLFPGKLASGG